MNPKISPHWHQKLLGRSAIRTVLLVLLLLLLGQGLVLAQTGPPPPLPPGPPGPPPPPEVPACPTFIKPPPGKPVIEITFPAVPLALIPPVVGNGVVVFVPATEGEAYGEVHTTLGQHLKIAVVPADPARDLALRIQELSTQEIPAPLNAETIPGLSPSSTVEGVELVYTMDLYDANTGEEIDLHDPALVCGFCLAADFAPATPVLLRFDQETGTYQVPAQQYFPPPRALRAEIPRTSIFVVAKITGQTPPQTSVVPTPVIPAGLPRTGTDMTVSALLWGLLAVVAGLAMVAIGFWSRRAMR